MEAKKDYGLANGKSNFAQVMSEGSESQDYVVVLSENEMSNMPTESFVYGEYPQSIVEAKEARVLESAFHAKKLHETGKTYTALTSRARFKKFTEYEFEGRKYIRVIPTFSAEIGDGKVEANHPAWFAVEEIKWISNITRDGKKIAKSACCLFGGQSDSHPIEEIEWEQKFNEWFENKFSNDIKPVYMVAVDTQEIATPKHKRRGYGVTIKKEPMSIKEQIDFYIENGKTFLLVGPSGCGKTQRIRECDPNFIAIPLAKGCDTQDIVGRVVFEPEKDHSSVNEKDEFINLPKGGKWYAPAWYKDICEICAKEPDKKHVLFIDEFLNVSEHQQALLLHLLGEHRSITANAGVLPDNAVVVLAGNRAKESGAAYNPTETAWRRCAAIIEIKPNVAEWLEWGSQKSASHPDEEGRLNIHPLVAAFVGAFGDKCFYTAFDEEEPERVMDPRGWEQVSDIIYQNKGVIGYELLYNKMGKHLADSFFAFAEKPPLTAEDILSGDIEGLHIPQRPDEKLALIYSLRAVSDRHVGKVRNFVHRYLGAESKSVFDQVWCEGDPKRALFLASLDKQQSGGR